MSNAKQKTSVRWFHLITGVVAMLFAGILYVVIATVSTWFPDKKGLCSGCLMMGFGASALILGNASNALFHSFLGWRITFVILGLCLTGMSYGANPTITAAFTSSFYGMKHYSTNMAFMTFTAMSSSLIATVSNKLLEASGGYTAPFLMLLALSVAALGINHFIRKP